MNSTGFFQKSLSLVIVLALLTPPQVLASNQQQAIREGQRDNAQDAMEANQVMTGVHGGVAAVCAAACAGLATGGWLEGVCSVGSLGAGVTEAVMSKNVMSAGMSAAMFAYNLSENGGLSGLASKFGIGKAAAGAKAGGDAAKSGGDAAKTGGDAAKSGANGAKSGADGAKSGADGAKAGEKKGDKMSCFTAALSAAQAVMSGMAAQEAKKSRDAAQSGMNDLGTTAPAMDPGTTPTYQSATSTSNQTGYTPAISPTFESSGNSGNTNNSGGTNGSNTTTQSGTGSINVDPCSSAGQSWGHAVRCANAKDSRIPLAVGDKRVEDLFKKLTGTDPMKYFQGKDTARAIGSAAGNPNLLSPEGLNKLAKMIPGNEKNTQLMQAVGVAGGGGGGGGGRGGKGGDDSDMADLAAMMKALNAPAEENEEAGKSPFERLEFAMKGRDPASVADDPTISIFDRVTYRYQIVSKREFLTTSAKPNGSLQ